MIERAREIYSVYYERIVLAIETKSNFGGIIMDNEIDYVITADGRRVSYEEFIEEMRASRN